MTLVKVNNPIFRSFDGIMKDFLNDFPPTVSKTFREDVLHFPPVNITEKATTYQVELAIPGFSKEDFNIQVDKNILTISSEKKTDMSEESNKVVRKEFSYKAFKRSFTLDEKIDVEKIEAKYENGILDITLPKKEEAKAKAVQINVQ